MWERDESKIKLPWNERVDDTPLTTHLVWCTIAHPPTPHRADPPCDRDANDRRDDEAMIAEPIVAAVEAMEVYTGTLKTMVGLVAWKSSHTYHATVVVLM